MRERKLNCPHGLTKNKVTKFKRNVARIDTSKRQLKSYCKCWLYDLTSEQNIVLKRGCSCKVK